jgi:hypothetical protein
MTATKVKSMGGRMCSTKAKKKNRRITIESKNILIRSNDSNEGKQHPYITVNSNVDEKGKQPSKRWMSRQSAPKMEE